MIHVSVLFNIFLINKKKKNPVDINVSMNDKFLENSLSGTFRVNDSELFVSM
jgi:hypothetical protein